MLETNIDNMNQEIYGYLFQRFFETGALDVYITPIIMKKNRPANKLSILCKIEDTSKIEEILFKETTTLGVRKYKVEREELEREIVKVTTKYGEVNVKKGIMNGKVIKANPEYEDCRKIAEESGESLIEIMNEVIKNIKLELGK